MNTLKSAHTRQQLIYAAAAIAGLILMLVWMQGGFVGKTAPGTRPTAQPGLTARPATAQAALQTIDEIMAWPAHVSARSVAQIAPKITARILAIPVKAGDRVQAGQVLARLDAGAWQAGV
ncbi:MAG: biotin/lipoyl-binding protein, partial [Methylococcaceae bacterium]